MTPEQEKALVAKIQNGDPEAFTEIYNHYIRPIYGFIFNRVRHKETTEDITSQVFFKAFDNIHKVNTSHSFAAWLYTIARNSVIDHYRRQKPTEPIEDFWDLAGLADVEAETEKTLQLKQLSGRMQKLTAKQREVVTMRIWDGLSHKEIADILEISETNSKVLFSRAVSQLGTAGTSALILISLIN